ncbi:uncharacterized protein [Channa argus]|uniref:uncharacterized protein isoform X2 n=1 Tax=Channa argus TaxID=215402 RepID=UPI00351F96F7
MCFLSLVSAVTLLLSLTAASPTPDDCVHLNRTLSAEGLHVIFGKWILHEAYALSSHDISSQILKTINSSQIEFVRTENNHTVIFKHAIMRDETCTRYSVNFTVVGNKIQHSPTRKAAMLPQTGQEMDKRQARCLGFLHPPDFTYNQAELCPEKSNDKETKEAQQ